MQNSVTMFRGEVNARYTPAPLVKHINPSFISGTRVIVQNLFGDMPVRVKQRALAALDSSSSLKQWDSLKKEVAALLLCCPNRVTIDLKDWEARPAPRSTRIHVGWDHEQPSGEHTGQPLTKICSVLYQAGFIPSRNTSSWMEVKGSTSSFQLQGGISLDPAPTKNIQFISININPILNDEGHNILYEVINRAFANSLFGVVDDLPELDEREKKRRAGDGRFKTDGYTNKELKGSGKGVDRWPMFCMRIEVKGEHDNANNPRSPDDIFEDDNALESITNLIQKVVVEFLKRNHLMPKHVPTQQFPRKRDRNGDLASCNEFQPQPFHSAESAARTKLPSAASQSPSVQSSVGEPSRNSIASSIPKTQSPFDIWPRVKSGRIINAPAVLKPTSPPEATEYLGPSSDSERNALFPPVSEESAAESSHFSPPEANVSKEGKVLRLPFLDVDRTPTSRKGSPRSTTPSEAVPHGAARGRPRKKDLVEEHKCFGGHDSSISNKFMLPSTTLPSGAERPHPTPVTADGEDGTTRFTPVPKGSQLNNDGTIRPGGPNEVDSPASAISYGRIESWADAYRKELLTGPKPPKLKLLQDQVEDGILVHTDKDGKETLINKRTGQTVIPLPGPRSRKLGSNESSLPRFGFGSSSTPRLGTRLPTSSSQKPNSLVPTTSEPRTPSPFVASVLRTYKNPVFKPITEPSIPQAANQSTDDKLTHSILHGHKHNYSQLDIEKAFKSSAGIGGGLGRLSTEGLRNAKVIRQVDDKFILMTVREVGRDILVLVDQHAADERIRIEALMQDYFQPPNPTLSFSGIGYPEGGLMLGVAVEPLQSPIRFDVDAAEAQKLRLKQQDFAHWGVCFKVLHVKWRVRVFVTALPPVIVERCKLEPKLIVDLIRKELYASLDKGTSSTSITAAESGPNTKADWLQRLHNFSQGILDMLNSRACRSAIMFNDELSLSDCEDLIRKLEETKFPFICAHGRPSMVPLVELQGLGACGRYEDEKGMDLLARIMELKRDEI